ncbi:hypothetical protein [Halorubellus sp. PRR65]|uniref:DUF7532 family protein n=1 Tax=Halorubellus sp. PRR65 TaxID=3098148 RepID=UPI002B261C56|nr:hypothetical protein [Halorubellus sp. PRR65]
MHFDQRTQTALREVGLDTDDLQAASERVAALVDETATELGAFFDAHDVVYSDMDMAHSASEYPEHDVAYCDVTTHAAEMRGWLRFETWGASVEDGRVLERAADGVDDDGSAGSTDETANDPLVVELSLGPSVHERVRFAPTREALE